jgi:hypothetical protein
MSDVTTIRVDADSQLSVRERAESAKTPLVWLLDAEAEPANDALVALLEHAPGPAASLPVDRLGQPLEPLLGRIKDWDLGSILQAVERHRLPLRHIQLTSLLVDRELVLDLPPPDPRRFGWYAGVEWTARLFARKRGMLVPASRVRVDDCAAGSPLHLVRMARSASWRKGETLRELHRSVVNGRT